MSSSSALIHSYSNVRCWRFNSSVILCHVNCYSYRHFGANTLLWNIGNYQFTWCDFRESANPYQQHCYNLNHERCSFFCTVCMRCVAIHVPHALMTRYWNYSTGLISEGSTSSFTTCESSVFIYESKKQFCESSIEGYFVLLGWKCRWLSECARGWLLACTVSPPGIARLQCTGHCNSHNILQPAALSAESEYRMLLTCWRTYCRV